MNFDLWTWGGGLAAILVLVVFVVWRKAILAIVDMIANAVGSAWQFIACSGALVLLVIGVFMPTFSEPFVFPPQDKLKGGYAILAFVGALWMMFDLSTKYLTSQKGWLFVNLLTTAFIFALIYGLALYMLGAGKLPNYMVAPTIYSLVLLFGGILAGVQNAWQKNPTQIQRTGA
jgi:hypothetical protein